MFFQLLELRHKVELHNSTGRVIECPLDEMNRPRWNPWLDHFRAAGYDPIAPGWPNEPATVEEARRQPGAVAGTSIDDAAGSLTDY